MILVDLIGREKLTNSFGLLTMFQGIATVVGAPIAGMIYDFTKSYTMSFMYIGITICVSGAMCFFIPCLPGYKPQNKKPVVFSLE